MAITRSVPRFHSALAALASSSFYLEMSLQSGEPVHARRSE